MYKCIWNWLTYPRLAALLLWGIVVTGVAWADDPKPAEQPKLETRIAKLIEQLGASEYSAREKAQADLAKIGLEAFDALNDAQHHDDVEIALRARYLVRSMQVQWHQETDSQDVIRILKEYGSQNEAERRSRIDRLKTLTNREGVVALCRLARFETSEEVSKYAALAVMQQPAISDASATAEAAKKLAASAGQGKRTAALWLRTLAKTLADPAASLPEWDAHIKAEHELFTQFPERTSREIVRDLYRFDVTLLQSLKRDEEAVAVMRRTFSLLEGTPEQLKELCDWLLDRKAWPVVQEVVSRYPQAFVDDAELIYLLAESYERQGKAEEAKQSAQNALALHPNNSPEHRRIAKILQDRGLFAWADAEYRYVLDHVPAGSTDDLFVRYALSEMLHDIEKDLPAAEVLKAAVDTINKDKNAQEFVSRARGPGAWASRMHYFYALDHQAKGEMDQARQRLKQGLEADPTDADVLIAMYRLPNQTDEQKKQTREMIASATAVFEKDMASSTPAGGQFQEGSEHATACNQYAWLVSNTFGDFDRAIQCSHKSVELRPDAGGYYDTLGRCYYAKGDFDNAIKYQLQALKLDPHSGQMQRQLALFQKSKAEKEKTP